MKNYTERMHHRNYFSFVRYGDGEFKCLLRTKGRNGRSQEISPRLHDHMTKSFLECPKQGIYFGMQRSVLWTEKRKHEVIGYLRRHRLNLRWVNADVFHLASKFGQLFPLIKQLRQMKVIVIGPRFLERLSAGIFRYEDFIEVPLTNAYGALNDIITTIRAVHIRLGNDVVYSFSTGPSTEILIQDLFSEMKNNYLIDFGSLWDVFCGQRSRTYTKRERYTGAILHRNLGLRK